MQILFSLFDLFGSARRFDLQYDVQYFEWKSAREMTWKLRKIEGSGFILTLETLTLIVKLKDRIYGKKSKHKSLMFELSDKKTWGLCVRKMTVKIEELPVKKENADGQPDAFLKSGMFMLR